MVDQNVQDAINAAMAAHEPALEQIARARLHQELTGAGVASDAQRDTILKKNEDLEEGCSEQQYLALSRVMEASDIKKVLTTTTISSMGWTPFSFIAALYAIGCITVEAAKSFQKFLNKAILGSIDPSVMRGPLAAATVFSAFWETLRLIVGGDYLTALAKAAGDSTAKHYQKRIAATLDALLVLKLDMALDRIRFAEEFSLKNVQAQMASLMSGPAQQSGQSQPTTGRAGRRARARANVGNGPYSNNNTTQTPAPAAPAPAQRRPATSRKSPFRTAGDRRVCPGYVDGSCTAVQKGGTCPRGRHGGSEERITFVSNTMVAPEKRPTPEQIKEKATE
eukprot:g16761.t1